ncbi:MAG: hypothetical protein U1F43_31500 [Myxococcota bacterium]
MTLAQRAAGSVVRGSAAGLEAALVFDVRGGTLHWHVPAARSAASIGDSRALWEVLWAERARLGGVAHTHPWRGPAAASATDVTTFAACEAGLGRRLRWVVATVDDEAQLGWVGPGRLDYAPVAARMEVEELGRLRSLSGMTEDER